MLDLRTEYVNRFDHFNVRVLDWAQTELSATNLPITMGFIRWGKTARTSRFLSDATA